TRLSAFKLNCQQAVKIAPRSHANEPAVLFELICFEAKCFPLGQADHLRAARLSSKIDTGKVRARRRSAYIDYTGHGVGDCHPVLRIEIDLLYFATAICNFKVLFWELIRKCHMRTNQAASAGDGSERACQLNRSSGESTLADTNRNHFPCKPFLFEDFRLPLFGRHNAACFLG